MVIAWVCMAGRLSNWVPRDGKTDCAVSSPGDEQALVNRTIRFHYTPQRKNNNEWRSKATKCLTTAKNGRSFGKFFLIRQRKSQ